MICNGTGIAPFLGMIDQNASQKPAALYCGFRKRSSMAVHEPFLEASRQRRHLEALHPAFSREGGKQYVTDLLSRDRTYLAGVLAGGGVLMICGSLAMQKDVMELLEEICSQDLGESIGFFQSRGQILTDCY
jgi:sulfite reductase (NADPH) flavoprotein alpha-component